MFGLFRILAIVLAFGVSFSYAAEHPLSVATNAELKGLPLTGLPANQIVTRLGFYSPFDGGSQNYYLSLSACPIAGGDNGSQVAPDVGVGCWIGNLAPAGTDMRVFGAIDGDSSTNSATNSVALARIFALSVGQQIIIPDDLTFRIPCGTVYSAASDLYIVGAGVGGGKIKLDDGCSLSGSLFSWTDKNGGWINAAIDVNGATSPSIFSVVSQNTLNVDTSKFLFERSSIVDMQDRTLGVATVATSGHIASGIRVTYSYFKMTPGLAHNQCVNISTNGFLGDVYEPVVSDNVCDGSGVLVEGRNPTLERNEFSHWRFGAGLALGGALGLVPNSRNCVVRDNRFHDTGGTIDSNNTPPEGIENHCYNSFVSGNVCDDLGGPCILNYTDRAIYVGNKARRIGVGQALQVNRSAFVVAKGKDGYAKATSLWTTWINNIAEDDGSGAQACGLYIGSNVAGRVEGSGNQLSGVMSPICAPASLANIDPGLSGYRAEKHSAAPSASIAFEKLPTTAYKHWKLSCRDIFPTASSKFAIQIGAGSPTVWKTAANYLSNGRFSVNGAPGTYFSAADAGLTIGSLEQTPSPAVPASFSIEFDDLAKADRVKVGTFTGSIYRPGQVETVSGNGYWANDNDPATALRVIGVSSSFYGSCMIEGSYAAGQ